MIAINKTMKAMGEDFLDQLTHAELRIGPIHEPKPSDLRESRLVLSFNYTEDMKTKISNELGKMEVERRAREERERREAIQELMPECKPQKVNHDYNADQSPEMPPGPKIVFDVGKLCGSDLNQTLDYREQVKPQRSKPRPNDLLDLDI